MHGYQGQCQGKVLGSEAYSGGGGSRRQSPLVEVRDVTLWSGQFWSAEIVIEALVEDDKKADFIVILYENTPYFLIFPVLKSLGAPCHPYNTTTSGYSDLLKSVWVE